MKTIDFRKIEVTDFEGNKKTYDISKQLSQKIYDDTGDLGEFILAQKIFEFGEVEIDADQAATLRRYICNTFKAFIQNVICPILDDFNNELKK